MSSSCLWAGTLLEDILVHFSMIVLLCYGWTWSTFRLYSGILFDDTKQLPALDILQQRFARGEIDAATYQQMRAQLEASARPSSSQ